MKYIKIRHFIKTFFLEIITTIAIIAVVFFTSSVLITKKKSSQKSSAIEQGSFLPKSTIQDISNNNAYQNEKTIVTRIKKGGSVSEILGKLKFETIEIYHITKALEKVHSLAKIKAGSKIYISYNEVEANQAGDTIKKLKKLKIYVSSKITLELYKNTNDEFVAYNNKIGLLPKIQLKTGLITRSLYEDALKAKIPPAIILEFIRYHSFDVDFQRDVRKNDRFTILYELLYNNEGEFIGNGDILFSEFNLSKKSLINYKYTTSRGSTLYFNRKGRSVKKALLKTPVNGARISSRFGYRRHPILAYTKLHTGIDFAAPRGTPVFAAGGGVVEYIGRKGSYGKYIRIRHNSKYKTAYAHLSRYKRRLRKGSRVKQGQVIAYVGTTGRSTGPHLHYEVLFKNKRINPSRLRAASSVRLRKKELRKFYKYRDRINHIINNIK